MGKGRDAMKWITLMVAMLCVGCAGSGGGGFGSGGGVPAGFETQTLRAAVVNVAEADYESLFAAAKDVMSPYRVVEEDLPGGRLVSGNFGMIDNGVPSFRNIEIRISPVDEISRQMRVEVAVFLYQRRFADGSPIGDENEPFEWIDLGLDEALQEELAQKVFRRYLEGA